MQESFWWWQCSDRYIISLSPRFRTRFQARSRDLRGGRWSWTFKFAQKRSWVGRWSWAEQVGPFLLRVVQVVHQQQCNGHCLCDSVQAQQLKEQSRSVQVAVARGHRLNTSIVLAARGARSLRSFSGGFRGRAFTLSSPSHSVPVPNKPSRFRGPKAAIKQSTSGTPYHTFSPSLISLTVSVDVKHHVYILNTVSGQ